jgi:ubiquinone/menaquinone biosynthesis C-methylase UbiE
MAGIQNYDVYTSRMQKSMYDKMFFVDKIFDDSIDAVIDFGCADGELILHLHTFMPEVRFIGYDIDETMLERAREKVPFAEFYSNWNDINVDPDKTIVNLSSVIHEVYNYAKDGDIAVFWQRLLEPGFAYVVIRDMFKNDVDLPAGDKWKDNVVEAGYGKQLKDFEKYWGEIKTENQKSHFLLKYKYTENWEREVTENYMPITVRELEHQMGHYMPYGTYEIAYKNFSPLPFIVNQIANDLNLVVDGHPTHLRIIFKKEEL